MRTEKMREEKKNFKWLNVKSLRLVKLPVRCFYVFRYCLSEATPIGNIG